MNQLARTIATLLVGAAALNLGAAALTSPLPAWALDPPATANYPVDHLTFRSEPITFGTANGDGSLTYDGARQITLLADVYFDYNQATLTPAADDALIEVTRRLQAAGASRVQIVGHTDSDGDEAANQRLSERRAVTVRDRLAKALPAIVFTAEGKGERDPIADNDSVHKAKNRRVTITIRG